MAIAGAVRVFVTFDELADLLRLPEGHRAEAASARGSDFRPGIYLTIAGPGLPKGGPHGPLDVVSLREYRAAVTTLSPQETETPTPRGRVADDDWAALKANVIAQEQAQRSLAPSGPPPPIPPGMKPPVTASDPGNWPKFPGEGLKYDGNDTADENTHTGGPR